MPTRFKTWFRMIGAAIEHAAACCGHKEITFAGMFRALDDQDEDSATLEEFLTILLRAFRDRPGDDETRVFVAKDVADYLNGEALNTPEGTTVRRFLYGEKAKKDAIVATKSVTRKLRAHVGNPVPSGSGYIILKRKGNHEANEFWIKKV
jgi:hypothetical protein